MSFPEYVIISPVRDEASYIETTIKCVASQTVLPCEWIIVDDGSTDQTGKILDDYASKLSWIKVIHRENRGFRKSGGGVIDAFYDGLNALKTNCWKYLVKLDGDLSFQVDYFENCFQEFYQDNGLGIGGGEIYHLINGALVLEKNPRFHVRGATKIYRRECWEAIGGLISAPGWDAVDEVKANMLGWRTRSFQSLKVTHHRHTGGADGSWRDSVKNGVADYVAGYHPLFMFFKCIKRVFKRPYVISSLGLFYGYIGGYWKDMPQINDRLLINYLRRQQLMRLLFRNSIWK